MERSALYAENHDGKFAALQAVQLNPSESPNTVVVVIGESETRTLMHAFNPNHVENTPWLTAMKEDSDFTLFSNAYSCVWYTVPVLERALTEANFYNNKEFNLPFPFWIWRKRPATRRTGSATRLYRRCRHAHHARRQDRRCFRMGRPGIEAVDDGRRAPAVPAARRPERKELRRPPPHGQPH